MLTRTRIAELLAQFDLEEDSALTCAIYRAEVAGVLVSTFGMDVGEAARAVSQHRRALRHMHNNDVSVTYAASVVSDRVQTQRAIDARWMTFAR